MQQSYAEASAAPAKNFSSRNDPEGALFRRPASPTPWEGLSVSCDKKSRASVHFSRGNFLAGTAAEASMRLRITLSFFILALLLLHPCQGEEQVVKSERTLSIIKPDAVSKNQIGLILSYLEKAGLHIIGAKMVQLTGQQAGAFYAVHKDRPFYKDLVKFMTSGPVFVSVLEGENAVQKNRDVMGPTDPKKAPKGTIRGDFARTIDENAVHGSDSTENAAIEIAFFFKNEEISPRTR